MKLPKELNIKKKRRKAIAKGQKKRRIIKKHFPVHSIVCECHNEPIPCPTCKEIEFLRGWNKNGRTLALCYFCGTVFYCDTNEVMNVFDDNPTFWASRVIAYCNIKEIDSELVLTVTPEMIENLLYEEEVLDPEFYEERLVNRVRREFRIPTQDEFNSLEQRMKKEIESRYQLCVPPICFTLKRIVPTKKFQKIKRILRKEGWKDWHFLNAILNLVINFRGRMSGIKEDIYSEEDKNAVVAPLEEFTVENLFYNLYLSFLTTLRSYGYNVNTNTDPKKLTSFLNEIGYWEYDVPHEPMFDKMDVR